MSLTARIARYEKLLERARSEYDQVSQLLAERQKQLAAHQQQLDELRAYADQLADAAGAPSAQLIQLRRQYLSQVFQAIEHQRSVVEQAEHELVQTQLRWREVRAQVRAMERLIEQLRQRQDDLESHQFQRQLDEQAAWHQRHH